MDSAQLAARLEDLTEHYDRAVDEVEAEIVELKRQISIASRLVESTPSFEYLPPRSPSPPLSFGSSQGAHVELVGRLEELTDRYDHTVEKAGAEVCRLQRQVNAARHRLSAAGSDDIPAGHLVYHAVSAVRGSAADDVEGEQVDGRLWSSGCVKQAKNL